MNIVHSTHKTYITWWRTKAPDKKNRYFLFDSGEKNKLVFTDIMEKYVFVCERF